MYKICAEASVNGYRLRALERQKRRMEECTKEFVESLAQRKEPEINLKIAGAIARRRGMFNAVEVMKEKVEEVAGDEDEDEEGEEKANEAVAKMKSKFKSLYESIRSKQRRAKKLTMRDILFGDIVVADGQDEIHSEGGITVRVDVTPEVEDFPPFGIRRPVMMPARNSSLSTFTATDITASTPWSSRPTSRSSSFDNETTCTVGSSTDLNTPSRASGDRSMSFDTVKSYDERPPYRPSYVDSPEIPQKKPPFCMDADKGSVYDGLNVMLIDGGGVRGQFGSRFLEKLHELFPEGLDPRDILDLVGGTSAGGLTAYMYARLGMHPKDISKVLREIPRLLFKSSKVRQLWNLFSTSGRHSSRAQENAIGELIEIVLGDRDAPLRADRACSEHNVPCFAISKEHGDPERPVIMSSYPRPSDAEDPDGTTWTILKAAMATSAAPTYFQEVKHEGRWYYDGGVGHNNPCFVGLKEMSELYGPNSFARTMISIGTGDKPPEKRKRPKNGLFKLGNVLKDVGWSCTSTRPIDDMLAICFEGTESYYRVNPKGLGDFALDDWKALPEIDRLCDEYLERPETIQLIRDLTKRLVETHVMRSGYC